MAPTFSSDTQKWQAVRRRDAAADRYFLYSVRSTGVFCLPSCSARLPRRENVAFHDTAVAASKAGFRPCKRCRPDLAAKPERDAQLVARACRAIDAAQQPSRLAELAAQCGLSPHHFHRLFKRVTGVTPGAYAAAGRQRRVQENLASGSAVTDAMYEAGFNSSGRFYASANGMLGMKPSAYRGGGTGEALWYGVGRCSLGLSLVAATAQGVCAILLGDDRAALVADLQARFSRAVIRRPPAGFKALLHQAVRLVDGAGEANAALPLDIRGTAFQRGVWEALRKLRPGSTATYAELASRIGKPRAVRAVAGACAANPLAVAVPCHRVVAADGSLAGYRWGLERKRRLIEREKKG
jgi:AraC family transcriptional regulator of adaptative response/methylated-DNA-[protein]-cysteine methyltransferase